MTSSTNAVNDGLDYLLDHFSHQIQLWPRIISTRTTEARQVIAYNKEEALARFAQANFVDCRISAYPHWRPTISSKFMGIKNAIAPNFIMIDLDACNFDDDYDNDILGQILWRIRDNLASYKPTVIWSGRGHHIHIQLQAPVLETVSEFANIDDISTKFIRFAEHYLSDGKSDHDHFSNVSLRNCMLRVLGSINSKNGAAVTLLKTCKSQPANINLLIGSFYAHIKSDEIEYAKRIEVNSNLCLG